MEQEYVVKVFTRDGDFAGTVHGLFKELAVGNFKGALSALTLLDISIRNLDGCAVEEVEDGSEAEAE